MKKEEKLSLQNQVKKKISEIKRQVKSGKQMQKQ